MHGIKTFTACVLCSIGLFVWALWNPQHQKKWFRTWRGYRRVPRRGYDSIFLAVVLMAVLTAVVLSVLHGAITYIL